MRAQLLHLSGPLRGRTDTYATDQVLIGTEPHGEVVFPDGTRGIAERHAEIRFHPETCSFHLRALNGRVFVNQHEILEVILEPEDLIELGIDGPSARFRVHVEPGQFCKPVRKMLSDASQVGRQCGPLAFVLAFARDLLTHATLTLKVGFPLAVVAIAFLAAFAGGRWGGRRPALEIERRYQREIEQLRTRSDEAREQQQRLRAEFERRAAIVDRWASEDEALRNVLAVVADGVCLLAGEFGFERASNGGTEPLRGDQGQPLVVEYTGSGFLVSETGHVLTNRHVVEPWWHNERVAALLERGYAGRLHVLRAYFPGKGRKPIEVDLSTIRMRQDDVDIATLRIPASELPGIPVVPISRLDPSDLRGARVLVLGYPTGVSALLARTDAAIAQEITARANSLGDVLRELCERGAIHPLPTQGSLNEVFDKQLVYDAVTTHGGSGGPVFGPDGKAIAVNFAILEGFAGSNFGVPIRFSEQLVQ